MLHPRVHFYLLNRHETTEFETGAAADAERDGVALPDLDSRTADTVGYARIKERSSERKALELSACTQFAIQCAESRQGADLTDGSLRVRGLRVPLTALSMPVSEATHMKSPTCQTARCFMSHAPTGRRSGHARDVMCR